MVKKKSSVQNIIIVILCILLLISITVGVTYSYQSNKKNVITGTIFTANLSISLGAEDESGEASSLWITGSADNFVPGDSLPNVALTITNSSSTPVYIAILFRVSKGNQQITHVPAVEFNSYNTDDWHSVQYRCDDDTIYACLVGYNAFDQYHKNHGMPITIVEEGALRIPEVWKNEFMNCEVTISVEAHAVQASLSQAYDEPIQNAVDRNARANAVAKAIFEICGIS